MGPLVLRLSFPPPGREATGLIATICDLARPGPADNGEKLLAWSTNGGEIMVPISELRTALETAYDPTMPDWPAMADIDDSDS
jgi:hypothetical protein